MTNTKQPRMIEAHPESADHIAMRVQSLYDNINRENAPDNIICHPLGVWNIPDEDAISDIVRMLIHQDKLLIIVSRYKNTFSKTGRELCYYEKTHAVRKKEILKALGSYEINSWNGGDFQTSFSLVVDKPVPKALDKALANYENIHNIVNPSIEDIAGFNNFKEWVSVDI